jgi:hypothetical protein
LAVTFGERSADAQARAMAFGVIHQPGALARQIIIQRVQGGPQLSRGRDGRSTTRLTLETRHDPANTVDAFRAFLALPFQMRQCSRSTSATITAFAATRAG